MHYPALKLHYTGTMFYYVSFHGVSFHNKRSLIT